MKLHITILLVSLLSLCPVKAVPVRGETREWSRLDGNKVIGKLSEIHDESVTLKIKGRKYVITINTLSAEDIVYIKEMTPVPAAGTIGVYEAKFKNEAQKAYYEKHSIQSLEWKGKDPKEKLSFILYSPDPLKQGGKLPIIIHLSGTGGIGNDNVKPLFEDGGGVAKTFLSDKLQKRNPCHVMIPQPSRIGGWLGASYTEPADNLAWTIIALDHLLGNPSYNIDPDRIYITGLSMGGGGVYHALAKFPNRFAAGIPVAWAETHELFHEVNVGSPMWIAVNSGDKGQPLDMIREFRREYQKLGGKARVTIYKAGGHDAWSKLLGDQKFRTWLFHRKLGE
ncbi:MAG: putative peptidase [Rubritalea sp.]|jgi:predicted peptidase